MTPLDRDALRFFPRFVPWEQVTERERFDDRIDPVNAVVGAIMDVTAEGVALTTDDRRPTRDELVAWVWLTRPDLTAQLRPLASAAMIEVFDAYNDA